ncbi:MAG: hypothetical protein Q8Q14_01725 [Gemmatimonadales bacterium]|nr:hypothetical protein [Gemmatimonadales bacterium]
MTAPTPRAELASVLLARVLVAPAVVALSAAEGAVCLEWLALGAMARRLGGGLAAVDLDASEADVPEVPEAPAADTPAVDVEGSPAPDVMMLPGETHIPADPMVHAVRWLQLGDGVAIATSPLGDPLLGGVS